MSQGPEGSPVAKLADYMTDEDFRNSFASDHHQALSRVGLEPSEVPAGILEALKDCSVDELRALSRMRNALVDAGVSREDAGEIV
jgi:hypothetical protein